jgi:hypothetical protein
MSDTLKVFKNVNGLSLADTDAASINSIDVVTTSATQQAVIKDLAFNINKPVGDNYKYPVQLKLDGYVLTDSESGAAGDIYSGTQIIDVSSSLTFDVMPEPTLYEYGEFDVLAPVDGSATGSTTMQRLYVNLNDTIASGVGDANALSTTNSL